MSAQDTADVEAPDASTPADAAATAKDRAASMLASRQVKLDELFKGKKFTITREIHLEGDERFETPFGNKGRHGFALQEVGNPANEFIVGESMLALVARDYQAVEVPVKERKRRTKDQKEADDIVEAAAKAEKKVAKDKERADKAAAKAAERAQKDAAKKALAEAAAAAKAAEPAPANA